MTSAADEVRLVQFRGSNPVLLVFTPAADRREYVAQRDALHLHRQDLTRRHVALVEVHGDLWGAVEGRPLTPLAVAKLRAQERVPLDAFRVILLDLHGRELVRSEQPLLPERLADLLDVQPPPEELLHA